MSRRRFPYMALLCATIACPAGIAAAAFTDTFENDTTGQPAANWNVVSTDITQAYATVGQESGNKFLAIRDNSAAHDLYVERWFTGDTQGYLKFDIRINGTVNAAFQVRPLAASLDFLGNGTNYEPINVQWQHPFNQTQLPIRFRSVGNSQYQQFVPDFPQNSWETITIFFESELVSNTPPRGMYWAIWNNMVIAHDYLNQGVKSQRIERLLLNAVGTGWTDGSIDIDNVTFVPEPGSAAVMMCLATGAMLSRRRRRS